jgi:membrane protein
MGRRLIDFLKEVFAKFSSDDVPSLSAALAYYTVFAIAPLLILVIAVISFFWGAQDDAIRQQILSELEDMMGGEGAEMIGTMLDNTAADGSGIIATIMGVLALLFGATMVFVQLQSSLNNIWDVEPKPDQGLKLMIRQRVLSLGMILVVGFLLLVSLVLSTVLSAIGDAVIQQLPGSQVAMQLLDLGLNLLIITLLFAMIFRVLPDVEIAWRDVWVGAIITGVLFVVGRFAISLYMANATPASAFGAAGSLVVLLLWVYYSSMILFIGAEITQVWAKRRGHGIEPSEHARRIHGRDSAPGGDGRADALQTEVVPVPAGKTDERAGSPLRRFGPAAAAFVAGMALGKRRERKRPVTSARPHIRKI